MQRYLSEEIGGVVDLSNPNQPTVVKPLVLNLSWTHTDATPGNLRGFRIVIFSGNDPNDTSQYFVPPIEVGPNERSVKKAVMLPGIFVVNAAVQSLYLNGDESAWRLLSGGTMLDPDTLPLATRVLVDQIRLDTDAAAAAAADAQTAANTAQTAANSAQAAANNAATAAANAQTSANTANTALADIASDGKLSPSEKQASRLEWEALLGERSGIQAQATTFGVSKTAYDTAFQALANYLNNGTAWSSGTPSWISDANLSTTTTIVGATFRSKWKDLYDARQALLNAVATKAKDLADTAQAAANTAQTASNTAQTTANSAQTAANAANSALADIAADGKLTPSEKQSTRLQWDTILGERAGIQSRADAVSVSRTAYDSAFQTLATYLNAGTTWSSGTPSWLADANLSTTTTIDGPTFRANWKALFDARQALLNAITAAVQAAANNAATAAANAQASANSAISSASAALTQLGQALNATKLYDFRGGTLPEGVSVGGITHSSSDSGTSTRLTATTSDPILQLTGLSLDPAKVYAIAARVKLVSGTWQGACYYTNGGHGESGSYRLDLPAPPVGEWRTLVWDMRSLTAGGADWFSSTVTGIRLDLGSSSSGVVDIDWVAYGAFGVKSDDALNAAVEMLNNIGSDGILSKGEKPQVYINFETAKADKALIDARAAATGYDASAFRTAYSNLYNLMTTGVIPSYADFSVDSTISSPANWKTYWLDYMVRKTEIMVALASAAAPSVAGMLTANVNINNLATGVSYSNDGATFTEGEKLILTGQTTSGQDGIWTLKKDTTTIAPSTSYPSTVSGSGSGSVTDQANIFDSDSDYATITATLESGFSSSRYIATISGFPAVVASGTLTLVMEVVDSGAYINGWAGTSYSLDGGATWQAFGVGSYQSNSGVLTIEVSLSSVNMANLQVRIIVDKSREKFFEGGVPIYDTWGADVLVQSLRFYSSGTTANTWKLINRVPLQDKAVVSILKGATYGEKTYSFTVSGSGDITSFSQVATTPSVAWGTLLGNLDDQVDLKNALAGKEPFVAPGTAGQVWKGTKSWGAVDWTELNNKPSTFAPSGHAHPASAISDSTAAGRSILTAADTAAQRTTLGLVIGTNVQAYDADLGAIAALAGTSGFLKKTAANTWTLDTGSYAAASHSHAYSSLTGVPSTFTPTAHTHAAADLPAYPTLASLGAQAAATAITTSNIASQSVADSAKLGGIAAASYVQTSDSRLTNSRPASDVYAWAKAPSKPSYNYSEVGAVPASTIKDLGIVRINPVNASNATCTTSQFVAWLVAAGMHTARHCVAKCTWDYDGNNDISDAPWGSIELAGSVIETWSDGTYYTIRIIRPNTGAMPAEEFIYNDQGSGYSPGWRRVWTSASLTNLNQLSNGPGYITGAGSCAYAASAGAVAWGNVTGKPTFSAASVGAISNIVGMLGSSTRGNGADLRFRDISNGLTYALYVEAGVLKLIQV